MGDVWARFVIHAGHNSIYMGQLAEGFDTMIDDYELIDPYDYMTAEDQRELGNLVSELGRTFHCAEIEWVAMVDRIHAMLTKAQNKMEAEWSW